MGGIGTFIKDVRRRRVLSNAAIYIVAAWVAIQVADLVIDAGVIRWPLRDVFADMAAQLQRVRAMEANGELEPIPDIGFNPTPSNELRQ